MLSLHLLSTSRADALLLFMIILPKQSCNFLIFSLLISSNISSSEITCETAPAAVSQGLVRLSIDNAVTYGGEFEYIHNPEFDSIYPHYTIPAYVP